MLSLTRTTRAIFRPLYRRLMKRLYAPAEAALGELRQRAAEQQRALDEFQGALAAVGQSLRGLQAAVAALAPRPAFDAVYLGQERLLGPHPCFPFMILDAQDPLVTPRVILRCYEPGTYAVLRRLVRPGMTVVEA